MKGFLLIILLLIITLQSSANRHEEYNAMLAALKYTELSELESLDTIVNYLDYYVRIVKDSSRIEHIGLNLFNDDLKTSIDKNMLDYVETALFAKILGIDICGNADFSFYQGGITDFKNVSPDKPCKINNLNSRFLSFEWELNPNKTLRLDVPISYEYAKSGSRREIEEELINKLKTCNMQPSDDIEINPDLLKPYREGIFFLKGQQYINEDINRNLYFYLDSEPILIKSSSYPEESIANLFIAPVAEEKETNVEIKVLKHEVGDTETFITSLDNLLGVCEADGCLPYWGLEDFSDGNLLGSLFLYNWKHGYVHILKIECIPTEILNDKGHIKARASLFVPTNNISSLFEDSLLQ